MESFADSLGCSSLVSACQKYVKKFFSKVAETEEFMSLEIEEVSKFISEDELFVSSEQLVFNVGDGARVSVIVLDLWWQLHQFQLHCPHNIVQLIQSIKGN